MVGKHTALEVLHLQYKLCASVHKNTTLAAGNSKAACTLTKLKPPSFLQHINTSKQRPRQGQSITGQLTAICPEVHGLGTNTATLRCRGCILAAAVAGLSVHGTEAMWRPHIGGLQLLQESCTPGRQHVLAAHLTFTSTRF